MIAIGAELDAGRGVYGIMDHYRFARKGELVKLPLDNVIAYSPSKFTSFTEAQALSGINDGSTTSGLRAENAGSTCGIRLTFANAAYLNQLVVHITQFNGNYNGFSGLEVWNGTYTTKHFDTTALGYGTFTIDLSNTCPDADTSFVIICKNPYTTGNFSLAEVVVQGYVA